METGKWKMGKLERGLTCALFHFPFSNFQFPVRNDRQSRLEAGGTK